MRKRQTAIGWAVLLALATGACNSSSPEPSAKSDPRRPFAVEGDAATRKVAVAGNDTRAAEFALLPDGLVITHGKGKGQPVSLMRFGDAQATTIQALTRDLGKPEESDLAECGAGPMHFAEFGVIKANFLKGKFVGWFAKSGKGLNTGDGIGPGKPFRNMARIGARMMPKSTLDGEFEMVGKGGPSGMGGFVGPDENVSSLFAGTTCFFR